VSIIAWVIFGALAGWVASLVMGTSGRQGCILDIIVGVVGAFVGGLLVSLLTGNDFTTRFDITSFIVAVVGAIVLLFIVGLFRGRRRV
jgi:uncharacterized membrane protein YeaQ/YmgE (transglycosylase-associated protein family)